MNPMYAFPPPKRVTVGQVVWVVEYEAIRRPPRTWSDPRITFVEAIVVTPGKRTCKVRIAGRSRWVKLENLRDEAAVAETARRAIATVGYSPFHRIEIRYGENHDPATLPQHRVGREPKVTCPGCVHDSMTLKIPDLGLDPYNAIFAKLNAYYAAEKARAAIAGERSFLDLALRQGSLPLSKPWAK